MITYQNMTPSQTFEERIVSVVNTGIDATATKIVCVTNGNLLRYKSLIPIVTRIYSGNFSTATPLQHFRNNHIQFASKPSF